ncbi:uncharacterized protein BXZ73DRAFT_96606 [Epithele typhae]|uniref:uncharacterized protein n=1 Tax=Epithele typhae TaxID=378194 RepID=UPI0020083F07|nr:uncharacterized protein BXZ73DRAFT_96606 [Epithele typhae]KAH9944109.1 hypothetical protein BXZ73DRAFT_96606 [Epithele typhae]
MEYFDFNPPYTSQSSSPGYPFTPTDVQGTHYGAVPPGTAGTFSTNSVHTPLDHPSALTVSTVFHPMLLLDELAPNFIFLATDGVHFYVHTHHILAVSMNRMGMLLPTDVPAVVLGPRPFARIPHPSEVVNIMLHVIYGLPCLQYAPTLETTEAALEALHLQFDVVIQMHAVPPLPLYQLVLSYAPFRPLEAYAVAAHYALDELAVAASGHLLAFDLSQVSDDAACKMGPVYLKRLFLLHRSRLAALRDILFRPPREHAPNKGCTMEQRQQLTRAWAIPVARLAWEALPSVSTNALQSLLEPMALAVTCPDCAEMLQQRVQEVVYEWAAVKHCCPEWKVCTGFAAAIERLNAVHRSCAPAHIGNLNGVSMIKAVVPKGAQDSQIKKAGRPPKRGSVPDTILRPWNSGWN